MTAALQGNGWVPASDTFAARLMLVRHRMRWNLKQAAHRHRHKR
jgi:hypothetical protein